MKNVFQRSIAAWVRYDRYEIKEAKNGTFYIGPAKDAKPDVYNPLECGEQLVIDALNVGRLMLGDKNPSEPKVKSAILEFASKYGLLGLMTGLTTTPDFMEYDYAHLIKNQFIREEMMTAEDFIKLFFPFGKSIIGKDEADASSNDKNDNDMLAVNLLFENRPKAVRVCMQKQYSEPYEWYAYELKDYAFIFYTCYYYYYNKGTLSEDECELYRSAVRAFGGIAPTYHIELRQNQPFMYWRFNSLMIVIQMMLGFMLVDDEKQLRMCKHCNRVFLSSRSNAAFCSPTCKNRYNVYKSRGKKELGEE